MNAWVLIRETAGLVRYYYATERGGLWMVTADLDAAAQFEWRESAARLLRDSGKRPEGWRVVPVTV